METDQIFIFLELDKITTTIFQIPRNYPSPKYLRKFSLALHCKTLLSFSDVNMMFVWDKQDCFHSVYLKLLATPDVQEFYE